MLTQSGETSNKVKLTTSLQQLAMRLKTAQIIKVSWMITELLTCKTKFDIQIDSNIIHILPTYDDAHTYTYMMIIEKTKGISFRYHEIWCPKCYRIS